MSRQPLIQKYCETANVLIMAVQGEQGGASRLAEIREDLEKDRARIRTLMGRLEKRVTPGVMKICREIDEKFLSASYLLQDTISLFDEFIETGEMELIDEAMGCLMDSAALLEEGNEMAREKRGYEVFEEYFVQ
jgi:hypothetical protein